MKRPVLFTIALLVGGWLISSPTAQIQPNGLPLSQQPPVIAGASVGVNGGGTVTSPQILAPDGSASAPSYSFASDTDVGLFLSANGLISAFGSVQQLAVTSSAVNINSATPLQWGASGFSTPDVSLSRGAAGRPEWSSASGIRIGSTQTTDPTCTSNCGTSSSVVGTDSEFTLTMGSSGVPASGFVVTFNAAWGSNPQCVGAMAKTGMVIGKLPMVIVTSTTTMTVTTNGTAPATTDVYNFICRGGR